MVIMRCTYYRTNYVTVSCVVLDFKNLFKKSATPCVISGVDISKIDEIVECDDFDIA